MRLFDLSLAQQSVLNIIGGIAVVAINTAINFLLSPYIVEHLGVSANGYITLANNFVSYIAIVTTALNSMCGRFILVEYRKGNTQNANEYYSSVLFGDWLLCGVFIVPVTIFVVWIDRFINILPQDVTETRILFGLIFINYFITLCLPQWQTAEYCTNNLYLRSIRNIASAISRALTIYLLFLCFNAHSYYVAIASSVMCCVSISLDYWFYKMLMPELKVSLKQLRFGKIKELVSSGIWNSISQCGNLLLEGLDILITNIFINPIAAGLMSLSKIVPNMLNQISGTVATTFGPRLTYLYVDQNYEGMVYELKNNIKIVSVLSTIPIGLFVVFGFDFFRLWVPTQNTRLLYTLSVCSLSGILITGISQSLLNVFGVVNKLKLNSFSIILSGLISVSAVYICLKFTSTGIFSIVIISSIVSILRIFMFTVPYSAYCIKTSKRTFYKPILLGIANIIVPLLVGGIIKLIIGGESWSLLCSSIIIAALLSFVLDYLIILNKSQQQTIRTLLRIDKLNQYPQ